MSLLTLAPVLAIGFVIGLALHKTFDRVIQRVRQRLCNHRVYIEDIRRIAPGSIVIARCNRCDKPLQAKYGLALHAVLEQRPKS